MSILATSPVTIPEQTFDEWYLSGLNIRSDGITALSSVTLTRSATVNGQTVLGNDYKVFTLDIFAEMADTPELSTALAAVLTAVEVYGTKKGLL